MKIIITESQTNILKEQIILNEIRHSFLDYVLNRIKKISGTDWPKYVVQDMVYKNTKKYNPEYESPDYYRGLVDRFVRHFIYKHGRGYWDYKIVNVDKDTFNKKTTDYFEYNGFGTSGTYDNEEDNQKFKTQSKLLSKFGEPKEPIICVDKPDGLELIDGYHRTMLYLRKLKSYKQPAYIYYKN